LFASGAVLGPFCDGLHSQHNVLHYVNPTVQLQLQLGELLPQPQQQQQQQQQHGLSVKYSQRPSSQLGMAG
jgi:hypothetical protein